MPGLPLAQWWSVALDGPVSVGPVTDGPRVYVALTSAHLTARDAKDGHEIWRHQRVVTAPMVTDGHLLFVASSDAVEALQGDTGRTAWTLPRVTPVAPLRASGDWLIVTTETELLAVRAATGEVVWRKPAGGVELAPVVDGDRVYAGAADGRVLALSLKDGSVVWERFLPGGVTALAAHRERLYAGAGDKRLYCLDTAKKGQEKWSFPLGAQAIGRLAVDDERVYVASLDNVVRALDRHSGNQHWHLGMRQRPALGVDVAGHVVFVSGRSTDLPLLYAHDGRASGALPLPGEAPGNVAPSVSGTAEGTIVYVVTGDLTDEWKLVKFAPAGETALVPFAAAQPPGVPYLTDPTLAPVGKALGLFLLGDPPIVPLSSIDWPVVLRDPPLAPFTTLPGVMLRPLSPKLPVRPGGSGPGD